MSQHFHRNVVWCKSVGIREYDYLVVATGAETNFFGLENNGVLKLKTLADAKGIRDHVVDSLEKVAHEEDSVEELENGTEIENDSNENQE